ncbi:hypothetical protein BB558_003406 [Smittium angustum]|uniref:Prefoldin subunit 6 n=1 Tax=Smittium angustum TaxID=133377 RepID=A0A2U1J6F1_SMIAN|nr:hypothetical protein BB558_003406 [Smittium angustum]
MSLERTLELESIELRKLQTEYSKLIENHQKLTSQFQENELVQKEFNLLNDNAKIFKLIGPVLVPQDKEEATLNVEKRIEYIKEELNRVDQRIKELTNLQETKSSEVYKLQTQFQQKLELEKSKS